MQATNQNTGTQKFEVGSTYSFLWVGDSSLQGLVEVVRRTNCFVFFITKNGQKKRAKVQVHNGVEYTYPMGKYAKSPVCRASKKVVAEVVIEDSKIRKLQPAKMW